MDCSYCVVPQEQQNAAGLIKFVHAAKIWPAHLVQMADQIGMDDCLYAKRKAMLHTWGRKNMAYTKIRDIFYFGRHRWCLSSAPPTSAAFCRQKLRARQGRCNLWDAARACKLYWCVLRYIDCSRCLVEALETHGAPTMTFVSSCDLNSEATRRAVLWIVPFLFFMSSILLSWWLQETISAKKALGLHDESSHHFSDIMDRAHLSLVF